MPLRCQSRQTFVWVKNSLKPVLKCCDFRNHEFCRKVTYLDLLSAQSPLRVSLLSVSNVSPKSWRDYWKFCVGLFLNNNNRSICSEGFATTSFCLKKKKKDWHSVRYCSVEMTFRWTTGRLNLIFMQLVSCFYARITLSEKRFSILHTLL